jgi:opacity protein-like surface antigen
MRWHNIAAMAVTACLFGRAADAQVVNIPPAVSPTSGWSFSLAPYVWLPTISSSAQATGPRGSTISTTIDAGIGDYISSINFAAMAGAAARYDRFSLMTDIVYLNASLTTSTTHLSSVNFGQGPIDIPRSQQIGTGTRLNSTVWSLAGGYTVLNGDWGNLDLVAGLRMLAVDSNTNYSLSSEIVAPNRTIGLSKFGSADVNSTYFNAIGGVSGRIKIPSSKFYIPFYFDAGGGAMPLTWQAYAGIGYAAASWADISVGYRYLDFEGSKSSGVQNLSLGGAILAANFRF